MDAFFGALKRALKSTEGNYLITYVPRWTVKASKGAAGLDWGMNGASQKVGHGENKKRKVSGKKNYESQVARTTSKRLSRVVWGRMGKTQWEGGGKKRRIFVCFTVCLYVSPHIQKRGREREIGLSRFLQDEDGDAKL